jgi:nucleotide-binding universal stress UspA family protein
MGQFEFRPILVTIKKLQTDPLITDLGFGRSSQWSPDCVNKMHTQRAGLPAQPWCKRAAGGIFMGATFPRPGLQIKRLLYCTDFSPAAQVAFSYAVDVARHFKAKLYGLYVRNPDDYIIVFPEGGSIPPGFTVSQAKEKLHALLDSLNGPLDGPVDATPEKIDHEVLVQEGEIWPEIAAVIENEQIDLLVAGTKGRTGVSKILLGSRAEEILRRASCPVLTVGPHLSGNPPHGFTEILFATDFGPEAGAAGAYAVFLAQEYQAGLTLLHVPAIHEHAARPDEPAASAESRLRELVPAGVRLRREPQFVIRSGAAAEVILDLASRAKSDLIVMGAHRPGGIPGSASHSPTSTAYKVVTEANCPVLTVGA